MMISRVGGALLLIVKLIVSLSSRDAKSPDDRTGLADDRAGRRRCPAR
jgi:hypothetical protein